MDKNCAVVIAIIGAIAAILTIAKIITFFLGKVRNFTSRPRLDLRIEQDTSDCQMIPLRFSPGAPAASGTIYDDWGVGFNKQVLGYYCRLQVHNMGEREAVNVEVSALELKRILPDKKSKVISEFIRTPLSWTHTREASCPSVPPVDSRHCDLLYIIDPKERPSLSFGLGERSWDNVSPEETIISLDTHVRPNNMAHLQPPGKYHLIIKATASNAKSVTRTIEIVLSGKWYRTEKEMSRKGIRIKLLDDLRRRRKCRLFRLKGTTKQSALISSVLVSSQILHNLVVSSWPRQSSFPI